MPDRRHYPALHLVMMTVGVFIQSLVSFVGDPTGQHPQRQRV